MPLIETKGAASAQGFGEFAASSAGAVTYIEDVFSTYLYTGNSTSGGTQTITNSIDLSTKGGMVWIKGRSAASNHILTDTTRGAGVSATNNNALASNLTTAEDLGGSSYDFLSAFNTNGFTVTQGGTTAATRGTNYNAVTYASWAFAKRAKFFDIVTYTGNGVTGRDIPHNLGSVPGCIIVKQTSGADPWYVYHQSIGSGQSGLLNSTAAFSADSIWNYTDPTSTNFTVSSSTNTNGATFVAYLFANNAGGFGLTGTDNVISCGSYTGTGSAGNAQTLGYEPQWMIVKKSSSSTVGDWFMVDVMRGFSMSNDNPLYANQSAAEDSGAEIDPTATGFQFPTGSNLNASGATYIYIAIRRGPMKVPTSGTSVFSPVTYTGNNTNNRLITSNFSVDMSLSMRRDAMGESGFFSRLTGNGQVLYPSSTAAEDTQVDKLKFGSNLGVLVSYVSAGGISTNQSPDPLEQLMFQRAPSFFDVVCYKGTNANRTLNHNLGVTPELIIVKDRSQAQDWEVYSATAGATKALRLNQTVASFTATTYWNSTAPTSSVFTVGTSSDVNSNGNNYIAYLFATCAGVSKVGSYTGTGALQTVNCGFTTGARFVLIKRSDSTGDWYLYDSARGITSGNDPYVLLNSTAAEVTGTNYVDTDTTGFKVTAAAPAGLNASGGTYIFLAIA